MACAKPAHAVSADAAQAWLVANGARLHLHHGPIDLIVEAVGQRAEVQRAYRQAVLAFESVLETLAAQLSLLRQEAGLQDNALFRGAVARRMQKAVRPYSVWSVTPMIAVAGAVADHILSHMIEGRDLQRVMVNNGGDIALHLSAGAKAKVGICNNLVQAEHSDIVTLTTEHGIGGIATSGWQGRSHSLGIADAVTVLSNDAASADVAATLIANAVDLPASERIQRMPARELAPDSDLCDQLVTVHVGHLSEAEKYTALKAGVGRARKFHEQGLLQCAYLHLQGQTTLVGTDPRLIANPVSHAS